MTVGTQDPQQRLDDGLAGVWRKSSDARLDRLEADITALLTDVELLRLDVRFLKADVDKLRSRRVSGAAKRFDRIDARLKRLIRLLQRGDTTMRS